MAPEWENERKEEFRERALGAAGPVFLIALGVVVLAVMGVLALVGFLPESTGAWMLIAAGATALLVGLAWAAVQNRSSRGAGR